MYSVMFEDGFLNISEVNCIFLSLIFDLFQMPFNFVHHCLRVKHPATNTKYLKLHMKKGIIPSMRFDQIGYYDSYLYLSCIQETTWTL